MNFNNHTPLSLHTKLTQLVKTERSIMHEVLRYIYLVDKTKAHLDLGYGSLFDYLVRGQGYSETAARLRIDGMRVLKEIPEVAVKLQSAELNLSQLHKVQVAIKQDQKTTGQKVSIAKKKEILNKIENLNLNQTESILVQELNYQPKPKEKVLEREEDVYLTLRLSKEQFSKLKDAQSLLSHTNLENDYASLIETMSKFVIQKKLGKNAISNSVQKNHEKKEAISNFTIQKKLEMGDSLNGFAPKTLDKKNAQIVEKIDSPQILSKSQDEKAVSQAKILKPNNRSVATKNSATEFFSPATSDIQSNQKSSSKNHTSTSKRSYLPISVRKSIYQKSTGRCEYVSPITGIRCGSRFQTQDDHVTPLAKGGSDHPTNFRMLCRGHNLSEARRWGLRAP